MWVLYGILIFVAVGILTGFITGFLNKKKNIKLQQTINDSIKANLPTDLKDILVLSKDLLIKKCLYLINERKKDIDKVVNNDKIKENPLWNSLNKNNGIKATTQNGKWICKFARESDNFIIHKTKNIGFKNNIEDDIIKVNTLFKVVNNKILLWENSRDDISENDRLNFTSLYKGLLNNIDILVEKYNSTEQKISIYTMDDIQYFEILEEKETSSFKENGKSPSKIGTAVNSALWGEAYATAKAVKDVQGREYSVTTTKRKAILYFDYKLGESPLMIENNNIDKIIKMMPEKRK